MNRSSRTLAPKGNAPSGDATVPAYGHIGLVVLGSIAGGLGAGAVLDLLIFGGSGETTVTGMALAGLAFGFALLAILSSWRTSQPQRWAIRPAVWFGVLGCSNRRTLGITDDDATPGKTEKRFLTPFFYFFLPASRYPRTCLGGAASTR